MQSDMKMGSDVYHFCDNCCVHCIKPQHFLKCFLIHLITCSHFTMKPKWLTNPICSTNLFQSLKKKEGKMIPLTLKLNILASSKFWYKSSYFSVLHKSLIKEIEMTCFYVYPINGMLREFCSSEVLHEANLDL